MKRDKCSVGEIRWQEEWKSNHWTWGNIHNYHAGGDKEPSREQKVWRERVIKSTLLAQMCWSFFLTWGKKRLVCIKLMVNGKVSILLQVRPKCPVPWHNNSAKLMRALCLRPDLPQRLDIVEYSRQNTENIFEYLSTHYRILQE